MKKVNILLIFTLLLVPAFTFAKSQVKASKIIDQINNGKAVHYKDAEIIGDLDFTSLDDVTLDKTNRWGRRHNKGSTDVYSCHVRSPLSLISCVFRGDVIGYVHKDWENETYNAVFHEDVDFQGCEFNGKSAFKYAKFLGKANFKNTKFHEEAFFKYAKFSTDVSFSNSYFYGQANFKYTRFPEAVYFKNTAFQRYTNFKYTKFPKGVSFENAEFMRDACFKYAKFYKPVNFDGTVFNNDADFKYTRMEGKSFTLYLLKKKWKNK